MAYYFYDLLFEPEGPWSFLRLLSYISFRSIFAFITAFGMSLFFGRRLIRWFAQSGIQETARQDEGEKPLRVALQRRAAPNLAARCHGLEQQRASYSGIRLRWGTFKLFFERHSRSKSTN